MESKSIIRHSGSHLLATDFEFIQGIIDRNYIGQGPLCADLKAFLATEFTCSHVVLTESGTAALHLCLLSLRELHPGKVRVVVSAYICPEVIGAVMQAGLEPVLADTCADCLNVDMTAIGKFVDERTLAIVCTHIGGIPDDYATAAALGVPIISDCAQAIGSRVRGHDLASAGICSILSFGPTKMITAGGGGALLCRSEELGRTIAQLAQAELPPEEYRRSGFRVTFGQHIGDLTAGLARAQLHRLESLVARRKQIAASYDRVLHGRGDVCIVDEGQSVRPNRFRYYFLSDRASLWTDYLQSVGIDARRSISHAIPEYNGNMSEFPNLGRVSQMVVSLPIYPAMSIENIHSVVQALNLGP
jgi:dTDP-4-amino-4,6-dideoxygalactose transaminase